MITKRLYLDSPPEGQVKNYSNSYISLKSAQAHHLKAPELLQIISFLYLETNSSRITFSKSEFLRLQNNSFASNAYYYF